MAIEPKYIEDIRFIKTDETKMNQVKRLLPDLLRKENLTENESKRERLMEKVKMSRKPNEH